MPYFMTLAEIELSLAPYQKLFMTCLVNNHAKFHAFITKVNNSALFLSLAARLVVKELHKKINSDLFCFVHGPHCRCIRKQQLIITTNSQTVTIRIIQHFLFNSNFYIKSQVYYVFSFTQVFWSGCRDERHIFLCGGWLTVLEGAFINSSFQAKNFK